MGAVNEMLQQRWLPFEQWSLRSTCFAAPDW
jgi:hypothetical protein